MHTRKMIRLFSLAITLVLALVAGACSSDGGDVESGSDTTAAAAETTAAPATDETDAPAETTAAPAATDAPAEPATIRFTWWGNPERDERTIAMVDAFMVEYPDITVLAEPTVFDGYFDKLAVGFAAGDAPDVVTLGGSYPVEYGDAGQLLDLTTAPASGIGNFDPNSYSAATLNGAVYGLPTGGNARGLLVNVDMFEDAGVALPDDGNYTWNDFVEMSGKLSAALPDDTFGTDWRIQEVKEEFAAQRGTEMYLAGGGLGVDLATMTELFAIPAALIENGGMPSAEATVELTGTTMELTLFGQGKAASMFGYSNNVQNFADILGAEVQMLKIPGESQYAAPGLTVLPSQFFGVFSGTEYPDEAALLLNWMLSEPEPGKIILANRGLSFNPDVLAAISPLLAEYEQGAAAYLGRVASEGRGALPVPTEGKGEVDDMTLRLQDEVLFGSLSPADAAETWLDEAGSIIP